MDTNDFFGTKSIILAVLGDSKQQNKIVNIETTQLFHKNFEFKGYNNTYHFIHNDEIINFRFIDIKKLRKKKLNKIHNGT